MITFRGATPRAPSGQPSPLVARATKSIWTWLLPIPGLPLKSSCVPRKRCPGQIHCLGRITISAALREPRISVVSPTARISISSSFQSARYFPLHLSVFRHLFHAVLVLQQTASPDPPCHRLSSLSDLRRFRLCAPTRIQHR